MCVCPLRAYCASIEPRPCRALVYLETVRQFTPRGLQENVTETQAKKQAKSWRGIVGARGPGSAHG